ncbi:MAG: hypothetical protein E3J86_15285, partial [Candidatus Thorarchaeota archaeon]
RSPRKPGAKMMDRGMASFIIIAGFTAFLASLTVFMWSLQVYGGWIPGLTGPVVDWNLDISPITGISWEYVLAHARTAVFASVVCFELLFVWNCRDEYRPVWKTKIRDSKVLMVAVALSLILTLLTIYFPPMAAIFQTVPINAIDWGVIVLTCIPALLIPPHIIFRHKKSKND